MQNNNCWYGVFDLFIFLFWRSIKIPGAFNVKYTVATLNLNLLQPLLHPKRFCISGLFSCEQLSPPPMYEEKWSCDAHDQCFQTNGPCKSYWHAIFCNSRMETSVWYHFFHIPGVINISDAMTKAVGWILHIRHNHRAMGHHLPLFVVVSSSAVLSHGIPEILWVQILITFWGCESTCTWSRILGINDWLSAGGTTDWGGLGWWHHDGSYRFRWVECANYRCHIECRTTRTHSLCGTRAHCVDAPSEMLAHVGWDLPPFLYLIHWLQLKIRKTL